MVNDAVMVLVDGADRDAVAAELTDTTIPRLDASATVSRRDDTDAVRVLYEDIDNDQRFWNALSALVLLAAALAAFNLINRIVEAQRREIGIGMALGVPRSQLAIRPMLIGVQVAILGTIAGVGVGFLVGNAFGSLLNRPCRFPNTAHRSSTTCTSRPSCSGSRFRSQPVPCRSGGRSASNRSRRSAPVTSRLAPVG